MNLTRVSIALALLAALTVSAENVGRVTFDRRDVPAPGVQRVVVNVYGSEEGETAIASETRTVRVDERGSFTLPLQASDGARWIAVRFPSGKESKRVPIQRGTIAINVVPEAAITAFGFIESTVSGFRFPDGSVQTTAAVGSSPSFGSPVAIGTSSSEGVAATIARSDHVHAHGNQPGGTLHSTATAGTPGFMSADDKTKLDETVDYVRTIVVSPVIGNETASGTALLSALSGITDNSATNPYLLKIEPGIYDLGSSALTMKSFVDIEGSGQKATFLNTTRGSSSLGTGAAAVVGASNAELRHVTISNDATGFFHGVGFAAGSAAAARLCDVTIASTGGTVSSFGLFATGSSSITAIRISVTATGIGGTSSTYGFQVNTGSLIRIRDSSITAKGIGGSGSNNGGFLSSSTADADIDSSLILATGSASQNIGIFVMTGEAVITNSTITVDTTGTRAAVVTNASSSATARVFHSRLLALANSLNSSQLSVSHGNGSKLHVATSQIDSASTGSPKCVHVYDSDMDDLNNSCPGPIG